MWWTWVWVSSGGWWWTKRPGVLQSMGSQRAGHNWATELTEDICWGYTPLKPGFKLRSPYLKVHISCYHNITTENIVHTLETPLCLLHVITHHLQVNTVLDPIQFSYSYYHRLNLPVFELHINGIMYLVFFDISLFSLLFMRFFCVFVIVVVTCWFPLLYRLLLCDYSIAYLPILLFICMWVVPFRNIMYNNAASSFLDISFGAHLFAPLYLVIKLLNHKIQVCSLLVNNVK